MDAESLRLAVEQAGLAAAGLGFLAGLLFSFNPVALASIPVSLAYVTRGRDRSQALLFGAMFTPRPEIVAEHISGDGTRKWLFRFPPRGAGRPVEVETV